MNPEIPRAGRGIEIRTALPEAEGHALETSAVDEQRRRLLGKEKKLILIRPDGYVGYRRPLADRND